MSETQPAPSAPDASLSGPWPARVRVLLDQAVELSGEHELDSVLQRIVEGAAAVADAQYAALGVYDEAGAITTFVHHGIEPETVGLIGELPHGRGLLGQVIIADAPIRLDDLGTDARSCGFPPGHPPMRTFLGAPISRRGRRYGNLYLTEKHGGMAFDTEDEALVMSWRSLLSRPGPSRAPNWSPPNAPELTLWLARSRRRCASVPEASCSGR